MFQEIFQDCLPFHSYC